MRKINIIGDIDTQAFEKFCEELDQLESESKKPVFVTLRSDGGNSIDALAFYGRIRESTCEIHVHVLGSAESAAILVLAAGDHRSMDANSWAMVHEDSGKISGTVVELEKQSARLRQLEDQWADLLASCTVTDAHMWKILHKRETYLSAKECLNLGLIDEIVRAT